MVEDMILIGIDAGKKTGFAKTEDKKLTQVCTFSIIQAMEEVKQTQEYALKAQKRLKIAIEDARLRKWYGNNENAIKARLQGVGSVKRDCTIWQEFCEYYRLDFILVPPRANKTKLSADTFKKLTGWQARTSEHSRDATMLIWGK